MTGPERPVGVTVGVVRRCAICGCSWEHGCMGPSRERQDELVAEVSALESALAASRLEVAAAAPEPAEKGASHVPGCDSLNDHGECVWPADCGCGASGSREGRK